MCNWDDWYHQSPFNLMCKLGAFFMGSKEKWTYASLAEENGFSPAYVLSLMRLVKREAKLCTATEE